MNEEIIQLDEPQKEDSIIKVIGVGGGGSNAVNHMYNKGISGVDFIVCNTDGQALQNSPIPSRVQLGKELTLGRGAGNEPNRGRDAAVEDMDEIRGLLQSKAKMVFLTAGMGGGTGTGAAPVIAQLCREMDILTVAIVTLPFSFEGEKRKIQAYEGVRTLKDHVDALLIIHNDRLREIYGDQKLSVAFANADDVLAAGAKGIAEIITVHGYVNVDFADVKTVMKNSGVAIMGTGIAEGEDRAHQAIKNALISPLLNNNNLRGAHNILLNINSGEKEILMDEVTEIMDFIQRGTGLETDIIWGNGYNKSLGDAISVTIVATGLTSETSLGDLEPEKVAVNYRLVENPEGNDEENGDMKVEKDEIPFEIKGKDDKAIDPLPDESKEKIELKEPEEQQHAPPVKKKDKKAEKKRKKSGWIQGMGTLFDDPE
ncbi:MAG: cell division protein FtsZ [Bacteroidetes bacterium]|nr:cell division protein FtsZ [Bacteroidota bacterium]